MAPEKPWRLWVLFGGRGAGKTEGGARHFNRRMRERKRRGRIIGPTLGDVIEACVEGPSGILAMDPEVRFLPSAPGGAKLLWPNGSEAVLLGTPTPRDVDRLRAAGNRDTDWWEEMAANPQLERAWEQADFGLRSAEDYESIATTTPRATKALRDLLKKPDTVRTVGTIFDNPGIPEEKKASLLERYKGTRLGRQELYGELLTDTPGALWTLDKLDEHRCMERGSAPDMVRIVVGVDPAATANDDSSETGVIVVGKGVDGHAYVLADRSCRLKPEGWGRRAVQALDDFEGDRIVAEVNNGGDMVEEVIRTVRSSVSYKSVRASRGKAIRAEPVSSLYEQGRVHHVGAFPELEDQMTTWTPESGESPDRLDALVWAITELNLSSPGARIVKVKW